jgi:hypothetical protein
LDFEVWQMLFITAVPNTKLFYEVCDCRYKDYDSNPAITKKNLIVDFHL